MAKFIKDLDYKFKYKDRTIEGVMEIDLRRFEGQYSKAQFKLDSMVMTSMIPYMPMQTGTFINVTRQMSASIAGSGKVVAAAPPMGRYLYNGMLMVDEKTGSPYARRGAKKVLLSQFGGASLSRQELSFSKAAHPKAQAKWFEAAKKSDLKKWTAAVKTTAGGGSRG